MADSKTVGDYPYVGSTPTFGTNSTKTYNLSVPYIAWVITIRFTLHPTLHSWPYFDFGAAALPRNL